jgi:menaquinone-dependent protoporphyrinogen IX oxidase
LYNPVHHPDICKVEVMELGVFIQILIAVLTIMLVAWQTRSKVHLDGSQEELNYRDLYIGLKTEIIEIKKEREVDAAKTKELETMMKKNRVLIALAIEMGGKVELESYEWFNEDMVKVE